MIIEKTMLESKLSEIDLMSFALRSTYEKEGIVDIDLLEELAKAAVSLTNLKELI